MGPAAGVACWVGLAGCGPSVPSGAPQDRFAPARPTNKGSISDAMREAAVRTAGRGVGGASGTRGREAEALPPGEPLSLEQTRAALSDYLGSMGALLDEMDAGRSTGATAGPLVDAVQSAVNRLVDLSPATRVALDREYGAGLRSIAARVSATLRSEPGEGVDPAPWRMLADLPVVE